MTSAYGPAPIPLALHWGPMQSEMNMIIWLVSSYPGYVTVKRIRRQNWALRGTTVLGFAASEAEGMSNKGSELTGTKLI